MRPVETPTPRHDSRTSAHMKEIFDATFKHPDAERAEMRGLTKRNIKENAYAPSPLGHH